MYDKLVKYIIQNGEKVEGVWQLELNETYTLLYQPPSKKLELIAIQKKQDNGGFFYKTFYGDELNDFKERLYIDHSIFELIDYFEKKKDEDLKMFLKFMKGE